MCKKDEVPDEHVHCRDHAGAVRRDELGQQPAECLNDFGSSSPVEPEHGIDQLLELVGPARNTKTKNARSSSLFVEARTKAAVELNLLHSNYNKHRPFRGRMPPSIELCHDMIGHDRLPGIRTAYKSRYEYRRHGPIRRLIEYL